MGRVGSAFEFPAKILEVLAEALVRLGVGRGMCSRVVSRRLSITASRARRVERSSAGFAEAAGISVGTASPDASGFPVFASWRCFVIEIIVQKAGAAAAGDRAPLRRNGSLSNRRIGPRKCRAGWSRAVPLQ